MGIAATALKGGKPAIVEPLKPFKAVGMEDANAAWLAVMSRPLSGYLGGERQGGYYVERLERAWEEKFQVKHAVACNSATSGILIACMAAGIGRGTVVKTTPYTMSGTIAPADILGANIVFGDINQNTFCLDPADNPDFVISVNIFGHPSPEYSGSFVIEDAAQSILATRNGKRISNANITVFSGNVHKQIQCGEGGMCCTDSDALASWMRHARNHGELAGWHAGLNLRLTEVQAAIWYQQLMKAEQIIAGRREIAEALSEFARETGVGVPPYVEPGCEHSYYIWALICPDRDLVARVLVAEGFPVRAGYVKPLYKLPAFQQDIKRPIVEQMETSIVTYENCAYSPTSLQLKQIKEAFQKVADGNPR